MGVGHVEFVCVSTSTIHIPAVRARRQSTETKQTTRAQVRGYGSVGVMVSSYGEALGDAVPANLGLC